MNQHLSFFAGWIPHNIKTSFCEIPPTGQNSSVTVIGNTTAVKELFNRLPIQFSTALRRKNINIQSYVENGLDEMEWTDAQNNLHGLISEYQQYQDAPDEDISKVACDTLWELHREGQPKYERVWIPEGNGQVIPHLK